MGTQDRGAEAPDAGPAAVDGAPEGVFGWLRAVLGGALMGLANLVPGISGGTMLLATGVYTAFVSAIADLSVLRVRWRPVLLLGCIAGTAALAILVLAGPTKETVVEHRWVMYSLFIGLTLGGAPIVWRLARPPAPGFWLAGALAFAAMAAMAFATPPGDPDAGASTPLLLLAGLAGASAMILPGVSGGYLLLLLGQYVPILAAVDGLKQALLGEAGPDLAALAGPVRVLVPVGIGVVAGVVGVSNGIRWLLRRFAQPTLGVLMGLLLGAVVGLWPFQAAFPPEPGDVIRGRVVTAETRSEIDPEHWPVRFFAPGALQLGGALGLLLIGLAVTSGLDRLSREAAATEARTA